MGAQPNVQTSMAPNQGGIQTSIAQGPQTSQAATPSSQVYIFFIVDCLAIFYNFHS